jgi:hypothetical protein
VYNEEKRLFKVSRTRLAAGAATVALAAGGIGVGVISAGASTSGCANAAGQLAGSCGDLVASSGYGLAVKGGNAKLNAEIVGSNDTSTSKATDFYAHQTNGNDNERVLEYAPNGQRSHLCITQTSQWAGLTLRYCDNSADQEFYGLGDTQNDTGNGNGGIQWLNADTGRVIDINRSKVTTDGLSSSSHDNGTYLHWVQ